MKFVNYSLFYSDLKKHGLEFAARHSRELGFDALQFRTASGTLSFPF